MATPNLGITYVAQNQNSKEVTINAGFDALDNAGNRGFAVSLATGNAATVTATNFTNNAVLVCTGHTASAILTVPLTNRLFAVINAANFQLTVKGATGATVVVAGLSSVLVFCDGTKCNLVGFNPSSVVALGGDGYVAWAQMKPEIQNLPLSFAFPGKPASGAVFNIVLAMAITIPANLAGSVVYDGTQATASAVFTLNKISGTTTTAAGTVTITSTGHATAALSTQAATSFAIGDVVQLIAPASQDATLADVGITILAAKV
jgi:hypothetical protein